MGVKELIHISRHKQWPVSCFFGHPRIHHWAKASSWPSYPPTSRPGRILGPAPALYWHLRLSLNSHTAQNNLPCVNLLHEVIFTTFSHLFNRFCPLESVHTHTTALAFVSLSPGIDAVRPPAPFPPSGDWQKNKCGIFYNPSPPFFSFTSLCKKWEFLPPGLLKWKIFPLLFIFSVRLTLGEDGEARQAHRTTHCQCRKQVMMTKMVKKKKSWS